MATIVSLSFFLGGIGISVATGIILEVMNRNKINKDILIDEIMYRINWIIRIEKRRILKFDSVPAYKGFTKIINEYIKNQVEENKKPNKTSKRIKLNNG